MRVGRRRSRAFTLIELMLVVAIIGLLAAIALPKMADLITKAQEASIKGQLGGIRSALSIYYADNEGVFPNIFASVGINELTIGSRYLDSIPSITIPKRPTFHRGSFAGVGFPTLLDSAAAKGMVWVYGPVEGEVHVACTHTDSRGVTWSSY